MRVYEESNNYRSGLIEIPNDEDASSDDFIAEPLSLIHI